MLSKISIEKDEGGRLMLVFRKVALNEPQKNEQPKIEKAETKDKVQPSVSHVFEMLLRKGIKTYKTEKKTASLESAKLGLNSV